VVTIVPTVPRNREEIPQTKRSLQIRFTLVTSSTEAQNKFETTVLLHTREALLHPRQFLVRVSYTLLVSTDRGRPVLLSGMDLDQVPGLLAVKDNGSMAKGWRLTILPTRSGAGTHNSFFAWAIDAQGQMHSKHA
jgi:hypothetical protein